MEMGNCSGKNKIHPGEKTLRTINIMIPHYSESPPPPPRDSNKQTNNKYVPYPLPRIGEPEE